MRETLNLSKIPSIWKKRLENLNFYVLNVIMALCEVMFLLDGPKYFDNSRALIP